MWESSALKAGPGPTCSVLESTRLAPLSDRRWAPGEHPGDPRRTGRGKTPQGLRLQILKHLWDSPEAPEAEPPGTTGLTVGLGLVLGGAAGGGSARGSVRCRDGPGREPDPDMATRLGQR